MPSRKRSRQEVEEDGKLGTPKPEPTTLDRIRNMSEFAALMQYLFIFGKVVKTEEMEVEDFEQECLKPTHSEKLSELGLALLKFVSSHRGLTLEIFDEYARRQYVAKAPTRNPFGEEGEPYKFADFDILTKIRVLHQLSIWTFWNPDKIREKMPDIGPDEQADWRVDPCGWDSEERSYFLFDDDRLYRQTDPPLPEPPKKILKGRTPKKAKRASRRRSSRVIPDTTPEVDSEDIEMKDDVMEEDQDELVHDLTYEPNFENKKWECVAITLEDYTTFLDGIKRSRDPDEKNLHRYLTNEILPVLLQKEEERQRKEQRRLKEMENLNKLATAKRSSRLAVKAEKQKEVDAAEEAERKKMAELDMAHKEQEKQRQLEQAHESRMMTREQRLKEREVKRILHEEQLAQEQERLAKLAEEEANGDIQSRISERQLKADVERHKKELEKLEIEEEWVFDCSVCGVHGKNIDDGTHSVACDKCSVWQHSACHGISKEKAERDDFHFVCRYCTEKARKPVPAIKLKFGQKDEDAYSTNPKPMSLPYPGPPLDRYVVSTTSQPSFIGVRVPVPGQNVALAQPHQSVQTVPRPVFPLPLGTNHAFQQSPAPSNGISRQTQPYQAQPPAYQMYQQYTLPPPQQHAQDNGSAPGPSRTLGSATHPNLSSSPPRPISAVNGHYDQTSFSQPVLANQARPTSSQQQLSTPRQPARGPGVFNMSPNGVGHATPASHAGLGGGSFTSSTPPTPHLPSPRQSFEASQPGLSASQMGLQGSSPGYSPTKAPSPPRRIYKTHLDGSITSPPVALPPQLQAQVLDPPVKKTHAMISSPAAGSITPNDKVWNGH